jgi:predicted RNA-binding Zn-ribbon protein involved in translation (DUF1610 family)
MARGHAKVRWLCPYCGFEERLDAAQLSARLRTLGMLKRDDQRDLAFLIALAGAQSRQLTCNHCGRGGIKVEVADEANEWDRPTKPCAACGRPIPPERLELFPDSELCAACQQRVERGQTPDQHDDYCPRCGARMVVRQKRGSGLAGYEMICPDCRR